MAHSASYYRLLSLYPPYLGAGIRIREISRDFSRIVVEMKLRWWNKNAVGTQFGGSLYSMCDPIYVLMLLERLGREYIVWDKAASIQFRKPGRGKVRAVFELSSEKVAEIKAQADSQPKVEPKFHIQIHDESGELIAEIEKVLYIRRKDRERK